MGDRELSSLPSPPSCRGRPLLLEDGDRLARPVLQLQSAQDLLRGGDFIPGFKRSEQQVGDEGWEALDTCVCRALAGHLFASPSPPSVPAPPGQLPSPLPPPLSWSPPTCPPPTDCPPATPVIVLQVVLKQYSAPEVPASFVPRHMLPPRPGQQPSSVFSSSGHQTLGPPPAEVPPPPDAELRKEADSLAALVSRRWVCY